MRNNNSNLFSSYEAKSKGMNFKKVVLTSEQFENLKNKAKKDVFENSALDHFSDFAMGQLLLQLLAAFNIFIFVDNEQKSDLNFMYFTCGLMGAKDFTATKHEKPIRTIDSERLKYGFDYINHLYAYRSNNDHRAIGHRFYQSMGVYVLTQLRLKIEKQKNKPKLKLESDSFYLAEYEDKFDLNAYCNDLLKEMKNNKFNYKL